MDIWQILETEATTDLSQIKRAYASKLKKCNPEIDPQGFQLLRRAYEVAQKHAAGIKVSFDLEETLVSPTQNESYTQEETRDQSNTANPMKIAFSLLDVLIKNELEAINLLMDLNKQGVFDNLAFAEEFQKVLAFNLLTMTPGYSAFIVQVIDLFDWYEQVNRESKNSFFGLALTNLLNQVRPYQFYRKLQFLSRIKNNKQAKKENLDWYLCYAAKILLNRARPIKFFFIRNRKKKKAILNLLGEIEYNYPQLIGMGLSISSVAWWLKYKQNPDRKVLNFGFLFIVLLYATLILENYYGSNFKTAIKNPSKGNESAQKLFQTISQEDRQAKNFLWLNNIDVKQVTGDHATNTLWVPEISNKNFKIELIGALSKENLYSHLANARYSLKVNLDIFMKSMDATTCRIHYTLVDNKTHKVIYSDAISATVIGRFLDNRPLEAFFTVVKANIKKFIEALAQLPEEASE